MAKFKIISPNDNILILEADGIGYSENNIRITKGTKSIAIFPNNYIAYRLDSVTEE